MAMFGSDRVAGVMDRLKFEEGEVITHPWITKSLERAQSKVEQNNFSIRKKQLEYDDVLNNQRKVIYSRRLHALQGDQLLADIMDMLEDYVETLVQTHVAAGDYEGLYTEVLRNLAVDAEYDEEAWRKMNAEDLMDLILDKALDTYRRKEERMAKPLYEVMKRINDSDPENRPERVQVIFTDGIKRMRVVVEVEAALKNEGREVARALERTAVLATIDEKWMQHLRELDSVKEGIGLRAFGQKDPLLEYKREAFDMFRQLLDMVNKDVVTTIWKSVPEAQAENDRLQQAQQQKSRFDTSKMQTQHADSSGMGMQAPAGQQAGGNQQRPMGPNTKRQPVHVEQEPGRNDRVTIQNMGTSEVKEVKWKYAKDLVENQGWIMVEK